MHYFSPRGSLDFIFCPTFSKTQMSKKSPKIGRFVFWDFFIFQPSLHFRSNTLQLPLKTKIIQKMLLYLKIF